MKTYFSICLSLGLLGILGACSSSKKAVSQRDAKNLPEARFLPSEQQNSYAPSVPEELTVVSMQSKYLLKDTTLARVYMYVDAFKGKRTMTSQEFLKAYNLNYVLYSDYGTRERLGYGNVKLDSTNVSSVGNKIVITFDIKNPNRDNGVLLTEISQTGTLKKVLNDLSIRFKKQAATELFGVYPANGKEPLQRHYVSNTEAFRIQRITGESQPLRVFYYKHKFEPAASPMNTAPRTVSKSLQVDSTFTIQTNEPLQFTQEGLYNIFADTAQTEGLGILVVNDRFPKVTRPELLLEPLLYMSTNNEIGEIRKAEDFKKALDKYWLNLMNGNAALAQQSIRAFYGRVEEANQLFTSYKEGWKTDKGMIYVVLGAPDKVQRSKDREVWTYDQRGNAQNVNFTFNRKNNQFVDDHYELVRYAEYQPIWYPIVEAWRNGSIR